MTQLPRWLKVEEATNGQLAWLDGGFTCHAPGCVVIYHNDKGKPYFHCKEGEHCLDGQLSDDKTEYVGVYVSDPGSLDWQNKP